MFRSPFSLTTEHIRARLGVLKGVIGPDEKAQSDLDMVKEARRLVHEVTQELDATPDQQLNTEEVNVIRAKTTASEILVLDRLPVAYLLSGLRDSCMEILALTDGATGASNIKEHSFATQALKELDSNKPMNEGTASRLFVQARQRLDSLLAGRLLLTRAVHQLMSKLWVRTAAGVVICSIPVLLFFYARYWHVIEWVPSTQTESASPTPVSNDARHDEAGVSPIPASNDTERDETGSAGSPSPAAAPANVDSNEKALAAVKELEEAVAKLPSKADKPNLDNKDAREFTQAPVFKEGRVVSLANFLFSLANESDAPADAMRLAKQLLAISTGLASDLQIATVMRDERLTLADLQASLNVTQQKARQQAQSTAAGYVGEGNILTRQVAKNDPTARLATFFSVIIMGILGAFVSNYSRLCALLREGAPFGVSSVDRSLRIRFSPFIGGLLAIALAEVFGAHLIQGVLFPLTEEMTRWTDMIWSGQGYSKLLVWGFVAGLSEDYVLRTIGNLAMKVGFGEKSHGKNTRQSERSDPD